MIDVFEYAYKVLFQVYSYGSYISVALKNTPINKECIKKVTKICYGVLDKDIELSYYISKSVTKNPKLPIRIIVKISLYCLFYLDKKPYVVNDVAVTLCKKLGKGANGGFVNALLRNIYANKPMLPTDKIDYLSIKYSFPKYAVEKLIYEYGDMAEDIIAFDEDLTFVRFNFNVEGEKYLIDNKYGYKKTCFDNLFIVKGISINDDFLSGLFTFQSIGSVAICDIIEGGETFLDACSAPGGKSVLLSNKFNSIIAFELHEHRVELIKSYIARMGVKNVTPLCQDSTKIPTEYFDKFDSVLCDVPCSGYGTVKVNPDIKLKDTKFIDELKDTQLAIIDSCKNCVKVGGNLYYSTCSLFESENDKIVSEFLAKNDNFTVEKISSKLRHIDKTFGIGFLPNISQGAGFYIAKLKRIK